jgi:hypothetical protein
MESTATAEVFALNGIEDTARHLGNSSPWTVRAHVARGHIKTVKIGRRVFIPGDEIRRIQRDGLPPLTTKGSRRAESLHVPTRQEMNSRGR